MYHDLLAKIKNAQAAKKEFFLTPFSTMDFSVAQILVSKKYLADAQKKIVDRKNMIEIKLRYDGGKPAVSDFKIVSKPSRHLYGGYRSVRSVKSGHGLSVISTSKGIMTGREARRSKVGGEYLFEIW